MKSLKKKLTELALRTLPRQARHKLLRNRACYDARCIRGLRVELARSTSDYREAFRLVHDAYVDRGWLKSNARRQWLTELHALPEVTAFVSSAAPG